MLGSSVRVLGASAVAVAVLDEVLEKAGLAPHSDCRRVVVDLGSGYIVAVQLGSGSAAEAQVRSLLASEHSPHIP